MDQQEQSCRKHDFFVQSTNELFLRTCLSCGFVEEFQLSQTKQRVDPWQGWLSAKIRRLSWPPGVKYSETDPRTQTYVYSYRPNMQTSLQNLPQIDVNPYVYCDLPKTSCIRLLELLSGYRLNPLRGRLFEVCWEQDSCPSYSALSYTWADDKGDTSLSNLIFLNEEQKVLRITRNCDRALRSLRQKNKSVFIWVDSICINQSSPSERSHQVALMKTIYSKAATVHAYVGERESGEDCTGLEAMSLLRDTQGNGTSDILFSPEHSNIAILNTFFSRPYFTRLWVVQELLLAGSITIHCGEVSLPFSNESISLLYEQGVKIPSWVQYAGKVKSHTERTPMDLKDLLIATSVCRVTDLRDKVFGLLGLVSDVQGSDLSPDYELMYINNNDRNGKSYYGIPCWVPIWDTFTPLQGFKDIFRHIRQIELDLRHLATDNSPLDCHTIRTIDGWPHDENSECNSKGRRCKTVYSGSGYLATSIETVFLIRSLSSSVTIQSAPNSGIENLEYGTAVWNLKDNVKIAVRSFAWALQRPHGHTEIIRVEGCTSLFLAQQSQHNELEYRLISPCVAAIACQTKKSSPVEVLKFDELQRLTQFTPLTLNMVQFIDKWRNIVFTMTRSDPSEREHVLPIGDQSCHYSSLDMSKTYSPTWRSWGPFLAPEAWHASSSNTELQKQLPSLAEFWDKAHLLHTCVRDWIKSAWNVARYRFAVLLHSRLHDLKGALRDCLEKSKQLSKAFRKTIGSGFTVQSTRLLKQLDDALTNPGAVAAESTLGCQGTIEGLTEDIETLSKFLREDQSYLDKAFPLELRDINPEYITIKQTMEWKKVLTGLVRINTEAKYVSFL
ncbi:heterokaryon incompatibility protein-domain-containing protein [Fusarium oxysporum Fo47]|uniref:heterokaryon incompatibility protein-domain-containing protein n=1 Tax=Fusarium oxysporum Fo47 TaxID=660027 RepID=UPI002869E63C|nr:heterokaryon incompatibility protein-domain-containing protein [Fusarium oxysporum Fo47]QKD55470.2 heterokaryon incompatibility protein-domain-containing protein [Fusarium oxysporum Fo47]